MDAAELELNHYQFRAEKGKALLDGIRIGLASLSQAPRREMNTER